MRGPDARGWIGFGCYALVLIVLLMVWVDKELLKDDFFKLVATAIILTAWINGPVGWAYQATKGGGEAAESSARIAETASGVPADRQPAASGAPATDLPAGTEADPLIVAGAPEGTPAVRTRPEKKKS